MAGTKYNVMIAAGARIGMPGPYGREQLKNFYVGSDKLEVNEWGGSGCMSRWTREPNPAKCSCRGTASRALSRSSRASDRPIRPT